MKLTGKWKIIIAVILVLLLAAGAAAFYFIKGGSEPKEGRFTASPYTCVWTRESFDCIRIEIQGELPENARWSTDTNISVIQVTQQDNDPIFTVKAVDVGSGFLSIAVRDASLPLDKGADFRAYFSVDENKSLSIGSFSAAQKEAESAELGNGVSACWKKSSVGGLFVCLSGTDWRVQSGEGVIHTGPTVDGDWVRLEISPDKSSGKMNIVIIDNNTDTGVELVFTIEGGVMSIAQWKSAEAEEPEADEKEIDPEVAALWLAIEEAETDEEKALLIEQYKQAKVEKNMANYSAAEEATGQ